MSKPTDPITPLERRSSSDVIADELRRRIVDGTFAAGSQLGEVAIAQQLGVSRGPVREAMQRLIQEGLLVSEPFRGVFVVKLDSADVADVYFARAAIERAAAVEIVRRGDLDTVAELEALVDKMAAAARRRTSWSRLADLDMAFHEALVAASGSQRLSRMYGSLVTETRICFAALESQYPDWNEVVAEHQTLLDALRRGDEAGVVASIDEHLQQAAARRSPAG